AAIGKLLYLLLRQQDRGNPVPVKEPVRDPRCWQEDGTAARFRQPTDGSTPGSRSTGRRTVAVRTQVGRLPLPGLPGRRNRRVALEIGPAPRPLFPRCSGAPC